MTDEIAEGPKEHGDRPRYRVHFETSADSPEELDKKIVKGMSRHIKRGRRKSRRESRKTR